MPRRRTNPNADETTCKVCGATIPIADDEKPATPVVEHFQDEHGMGE
jgi:hypothetical protein